MSRRSKSSSKNKGGVSKDGPLPSYPSENYKEHRKFLIRSLERNDVDMSALIKLNKSLHIAKDKIIQTCGELVLLDLGSGRLKLINDELHEETTDTTTTVTTSTSTNTTATTGSPDRNIITNIHQHHLTPAQKEVCVDFLLRMKLRRKLSNRLIRRLNRIAHAMDGKDVSPPSPPKYGDLGLHIDPKSIEARTAEWKEQEDAKKRVQKALDGDYSAYNLEEKGTGAAIIVEDTGNVEVTKKMEENSNDDEHGKGEKGRSDEDKTNNAEAQDEALPEEPKSSTEDKAADSNKIPKTMESSAAADKKEPLEIKADLDLEPTTQANNYSSSPTLAGDIESLKEYETAFEKSWDPSTKKFKYVLVKEEVGDPEYTQIKQCGIGASSIIMTLEDRKSEHLRWERNMLARIPEQPTTEDLGLKNRVFDLEERRKRCLEDNDIEDEQEESNLSVQSPMKKKIKFDEGTKPGNESTGHQAGGKELKNKSVESQEDETSKSSDSDNDNDNDKDVEMKKEKKEAIVVTPVKPISFVAVPSFHDQDLARIRMIHNELVNASRLEHTRTRLADATNDYNKVHLMSTELYDTRQLIQRNLTFNIAKGRQELNRAHSEYAIAYTNVKQRWMMDRMTHDMEKCNSILPTKWGSRPYGSEKTKKFITDAGSNLVKSTVGETIADIVDGSILVNTGKATLNRFREFVAPPAPGLNAETGENMAQRQNRIEMEHRNQYTIVEVRFQKTEVERTRAWRKMMKAQSDLQMLPAQNRGGPNGRGGHHRINFLQIPLPSLRTTMQQNIPRLPQQVAPVASYTPRVSAPASDSKYSAARIKQRKAADGTVAPVSEPKKSKDGLYLRPAGRTRKGMDWDAVNGVWVPQQA